MERPERIIIKKMEYILTQEEINNLIPVEKYRDEKKKVEILIKDFKEKGFCDNLTGNGYCDNCPIASLNNQFKVKICKENYSK